MQKMAKDPSQTKIPRLDGGGVVPTSKIPMSSAARCGKTSLKTTNSIKSSATNVFPKSLATQKLCEVTSLVRKKTHQVFHNRFALTSTPSIRHSQLKSSIESEAARGNKMIIDESPVSTPDLERITLAAEPSPPHTQANMTRILARSDTFTCDTDNSVVAENPEALNTFRISCGSISCNTVTGPNAEPSLSQANETKTLPHGIAMDSGENENFNRISCGSSNSNLFDTSECLVGTPPLLGTSTPCDMFRSFSLDINNDSTSNFSPVLPDTDVCIESSPASSSTGHKMINSTMLESKPLLDITGATSLGAQNLNFTISNANNTKLLYMSSTFANIEDECMDVDERHNDGDLSALNAVVNTTNGATASSASPNATDSINATLLPSQMAVNTSSQPKFPFSLDLTDCTLNCSIELCDISLASSGAHPNSPSAHLKKQNSFEIDESLGILTPDQMKEFLDSTNTNTNLDLLLKFPEKLSMHQCRVDQTPSPEELPLDPIEVKTADMFDIDTQLPQTSYHQEQQLSQTDSYSKTDQMTKSASSKVSNSFITSVTSITSLDTGYQGDGEMSRPASRGGDHSPSNISRSVQIMRNIHSANAGGAAEPLIAGQEHNRPNQNIPIVRRQDPMTDSDFFTESDAEDVMHRGDRRAQIIDGHLYGAAMQGVHHGANVYIRQQPSSQTEDSCMESSGIFTDVENRGDEDLMQQRHDNDSDMSPDCSTDTIKSTNTEYSKKIKTPICDDNCMAVVQGQCMSDSTTSTINSNSDGKGRDRLNSTTTTISDASASTDVIVAVDGASVEIQSSANAYISSNIQTVLATTSAAALNDKLKKNAISGSESTATTTKQTKKTSTSPKQNKNEANVALKKHELLSKRDGGGGGTVGGGGSSARKQNCGGKLKKSTSLASSECGDMENQENKRPVVVASALTSPSGSNSGSGGLNVALRKMPQNKWDAVMNKIAINKTSVKNKNYNEVKSKVTCGIGKRTSPVLLKNTPAQDEHQDSEQQLIAKPKRLFPISSKRGRTNSKDSSQSDISLTTGSPKMPHPSSPSDERAAKKRDVRTISISPTDLGPPNKSNGNAKTINIKPVTLQKRYSPNVTTISAALNTSITPDSKCTSASKKCATKVSKTPLKDHNRMVGLTASPSLKGITTTKTSTTKSIPSSPSIVPSNIVSSTLQQQSIADGTKQISGAAEIGPNVNNHNNSHIYRNSAVHTSVVDQQTHHHHHSQPSHFKSQTNSNQIVRIVNNGKLSNGLHSNDAASTATKAVMANLPSSDGTEKVVQALGVVIQYLAHDLDAFGNAHWKETYENSKKSLLETKIQLDDSQLKCVDLQETLLQTNTQNKLNVDKLEELHRYELQTAQNALTELERSAKERITAFELEINNKTTQCNELQSNINACNVQLDAQDATIKMAKDKEMEQMKRINVLSTTENELREKVHASENEFSQRLHAASIRERELIEKSNQLMRQIETLNKETEHKERILEEKLSLTQDEVVVLRHTRHSLGSQNVSPRRPVDRPQMLQDEVESLRCVLDLKQREISELRKQNHELEKNADALPVALVKVSGLESRLEDLQIQLKSKNNDEKILIHKCRHLEQRLHQEADKSAKLACHTEQLQYKLMQNSEKFTTAINEVTKHYQDHSEVHKLLAQTKASLYSHENSSQTISDVETLQSFSMANKSSDFFTADEISPPQTPVIKGVVEKCDSVSWVLEINDDESAEALATRMVRRAGSFRSVLSERSPIAQHTPAKKRQFSQSNGNGSKNPLTQSASATSILRPYSETSPISQKHTPNVARTRSKSVSINAKPARDAHKLARSNSTANNKLEWNEPLCASSPICHQNQIEGSKEILLSEESEIEGSPKTRMRSDSFSDDGDMSPTARTPFRRHNSTKLIKRNNLITCSTATLTSPRPELQLASTSSEGGQQFQQIKESAGEALISEDEEASADGSSDESMSVSSGHTDSSHSHSYF